MPWQVTGNHWLSLPCIHPADGSLYALGVLHRGARAALEFAVRVLEVTDLIVMGHAMCGGIGVLLRGPPSGAGDFLMPWMRIAEPAKRRALARAGEGGDAQTECEQESVKLSLENLLTFPFVRAAVERGDLSLHGAYFGVAEGSLFVLDQAAKEFRRVQGSE